MTGSSQRISIDAIPPAGQRDAWLDALARLGLNAPADDAGAVSTGEIAVKTSTTGAALAQLRCSAQRLLCKPGTQPAAMLVIFHTQGRGRYLGAGGLSAELADGDLSVADTRESWTLELRSDFELLVLRLPERRLRDRMGHIGLRLPAVLGASVAAAAARPLMRTLAASFPLVHDADLPSAETAIVELVGSALLSEARPAGDGTTQVQAAHLRRVLAAVEAQLGDPDLAMADIARREQLSPRYLQRLFEQHGLSFSEYIRQRRLERCRLDLIDPQYAQQGIAEIAHRWGFRDQAHFSRAFSAAYGKPPRLFRSMGRDKAPAYPFRGRPPARAAAASSTQRPPSQHGDPAGNVTEPGPARVVRLHDTARPDREAGSDFHLPATAETVHWGHIGRTIPPVMRVPSGARVTIETLTQHAFDDYERMIKGDPGAESVFRWTPAGKAVERRGAGPMNASIFGRGAGEGFGVHICTGPVHVNGAEPGDVLAVEILDAWPRPSANPEFAGRCFGSNAAAWWGYQYDDLIEQPSRRETITIFELEPDGSHARAVYSYRWTPQTDPYGVRHETMDYPGIPINHATVEARHGVLAGVRVPTRLHFGFMGVAPKEADVVDSIPPGYFGGNIDNWRAGKGATLYLPVAVPGALLSVGDAHLPQGDGEVNGTGLEASVTGVFRLVLHKKAGLAERSYLNGLSAPLIETPDAFVLHGLSYPNYLRQLGRNAQTEVYRKSSVDAALRNTFRATRRFLITHYGLDEDEAVALMSVAVDFGITQVADGNWGVHAVVKKAMLADR